MKESYSVYTAFLILEDGDWHSSKEIIDRCGQDGLRRARSLRDARYGGFTLLKKSNDELFEELKDNKFLLTSGYWYKLGPEEKLNDLRIKACLHAKTTVGILKKGDKKKALECTVDELVVLLAALRGISTDLTDTTYLKWRNIREFLMVKIANRIPSSILSLEHYLYDNRN